MTTSPVSVFLVVQALLFSASLPIRTAGAADLPTPSPSCIKPKKPLEFSSEWQVDQFMSQVESYKACIKQFVDEQRETARIHQEAANAAIEEWNSFVDWTPSRPSHSATTPTREPIHAGVGDRAKR